MNNGPVLIVDDDMDDRELIKEAWDELPFDHALLFFSHGKDVLNYLQSGKPIPFLILCDVNLPKMDGFALKEKLKEDTDLNYKSIPLVFWSNAVSKAQIQKAYDIGVNGFFVKESSFEELKKSLTEIVEYWMKSKVPE